MRQEYFDVHENQNQKNADPQSPSKACANGQKTISRYCPFKHMQ
jgi:hypothetical protein